MTKIHILPPKRRTKRRMKRTTRVQGREEKLKGRKEGTEHPITNQSFYITGILEAAQVITAISRHLTNLCTAQQLSDIPTVFQIWPTLKDCEVICANARLIIRTVQVNRQVESESHRVLAASKQKKKHAFVHPSICFRSYLARTESEHLTDKTKLILFLDTLPDWN